MMPVPRLRVFAGPNGSGKSTIKNELDSKLIYTYVNADDIERSVVEQKALDLAPFGIATTSAVLQAFFVAHGLACKPGHEVLKQDGKRLHVIADQIDFSAVEVNSYHAAIVADFIRHQLLALGRSFTFETVMSSADKIDFMRMAQQAGYRTYLYFVATESPDINLTRVSVRVSEGGHDVPADRVRARYKRVLDLLPAAISASNRAFIFDNSQEALLIAEVTEGTELEFHQDEMPEWFSKAYLDKVV